MPRLDRQRPVEERCVTAETRDAAIPHRPLRIGVDIGGTFTDVLLFDSDSGDFFLEKVLTTPDDPSRAVREGIRQLLESSAREPEGVGQIVHGTTLVTNALIERKGARTALLT